MGLIKAIKKNIATLVTNVASNLQNTNFEDRQHHHAHARAHLMQKRRRDAEKHLADFAQRQLDELRSPTQRPRLPEQTENTWDLSVATDVSGSTQQPHYSSTCGQGLQDCKQSSTLQQQYLYTKDAATEPQQTQHISKQFTVVYCPRDRKQDEQNTHHEVQLPTQLAWLHTVQTSIHRLGHNREIDQDAPFAVPWPWLVHDLLRLLPETSCYTVLLEDSALLSQILQQLTDADPDVLSAPGKKMLAQVISELAQEAPQTLASYTQTHKAILQRLKQVCTQLLDQSMPDDQDAHEAAAKMYALKLASSLLTALPTDADTKAQQRSLKLAAGVITLLPQHLHNTAFSELLLPLPAMSQIYLQSKVDLDHQQLAHVRLAAALLKSHLSTTSTEGPGNAHRIGKWRVWYFQSPHATAAPELQAATAQLAYLANQFLFDSAFVRMQNSTRQSITAFDDLVQDAFQPRQLQDRLHAWHSNDKDAHIVSLVKWVALLYGNAKQLGAATLLSSYKGELLEHLDAVKATINVCNVSKQQKKEMDQALQQLRQASLTSLPPKASSNNPRAQAVPAKFTQAPIPHRNHGHKPEGPKSSAPPPAGTSKPKPLTYKSALVDA